MSDIYLSVVIPVYNEEECLETLYKRLTAVLDQMTRPFEIIFTNDGSKDGTSALLADFYHRRPHQIRVIEFNRNYGQHMAIMAAFERSRGEVVVNLDADLQNPPEEIPNLLKKIDEGHDVVGSYRARRHDNFFRTHISQGVNYVRGKLTSVNMRDHGCMLRAYRRDIVDQIIQCEEAATFITALAYSFAGNPAEIPVQHEPRREGTSKYDMYRLVRVFFDLFTGFSLAPLHIFTAFGMIVSCLSGVLVAYLLGRRLIIGPEAEGMFTLFAIMFFLISVAIFGIGIIGEYVGRAYQAVQQRPRFVIRTVLETLEDKPVVTETRKLRKRTASNES